MQRIKVVDAVPKPGRVKAALKAGPHGKSKNADGTPFSSPNPHPPTSGGNGSKGLKGLTSKK
jgi:hypothetical protein